MILTFLEIGAFVSSTVYLIRWRFVLSRQRAYTWNMLVAQLQPKPGDRALCNQPIWDDEQFATPGEVLRDLQGGGLWKMYQNARVMLDIADYAARNSDSVDPELLASLRNDATEIRVGVLKALAEQARGQVNEGTLATVSRAMAYYAGMVKRMDDLVRANDRVMAPRFAASMYAPLQQH